MEDNKYLSELQGYLKITNDCFCDALLLVTGLPSDLHVKAINFCKQFLKLLEQDLSNFEGEELQINIKTFCQQFIGEKGQSKDTNVPDLMKAVKREFSLLRSELFSEYGSLQPNVLEHLDKCCERLELLESKLIYVAKTCVTAMGDDYA